MSLKQDFEKAFESQINSLGFDSVEADPQMVHLLQKAKLSLWAAKWMGDRICKERFPCLMDGFLEDHINIDRIRQMVKELEG